MPKRGKKIYKAILYNAFVFGSIVILSSVIIAFSKDVMRAKKIDSELAALQGDIVKIERKNVELGELIKYFDSASYAEKKARMELGLKKPDEGVIIIPKTNRDEQIMIAKETQNQESNFRRWWNYFFEKK